MTAGHFGRRFWRLTALGYVLAVLTVALAVAISSAPALRQMQNEATLETLGGLSQVVSDHLDDITDQGAYWARNSDVIGHVLGNTGYEARARDTLSENVRMKNIRLVDYKGQTVLSLAERETASHFHMFATLRDLHDMVEGRLAPKTSIHFRPDSSPEVAQFMIAVPVVSQGLVEGLLSYEIDINVADLVAPENHKNLSTVMATSFQLANWAEWRDLQNVISFQVPGTDLHLIAALDEKKVRTLGRGLVYNAIIVAICALVFPFSLMYLSGTRAIVAPHRDLEKSQAALARKTTELAQLAHIAEMAAEGISVSDENHCIVWVNPAFARMCGYTRDELLGKPPSALLHGPDTGLHETDKIFAALKDSGHGQGEIIYYRKDGTPFWVNLSISRLDATQGEPVQFAAIATEITAIKKAQFALQDANAKTEFQARHDPLTGLPNRRLLDTTLETEVSDRDIERTLVRIDLDHFKHVNDTLGHAAGDHVLIAVADILRDHVLEVDLAARVGGDEFVILLGPGRTSRDAEELTEVLRAEIRKEITFEDQTCRIGASFGISSAIGGLISNQDLLKSADAALYIAKESGRNTTTTYGPAIHQSVLHNRKLSGEISEGIKKSEFKAHFQPQFDAQTEELVGLEALARWHHPERGTLPPSEFLDVAERLRLVPDIDRQVFQYGLDRVAQLNAQGLFIPKVSFNVGIHQLTKLRLEDLVQGGRIGNTRIALEVLESVLIEGQDMTFMRRINELRDAGFMIEIDDFGSGHASVVGLKKLKPDVMKLDRLLVQPICENAADRALVRSMIEMGKALEISVTAEGIETAEHAVIMRELGCNTFQGFYFSRPLPFEQLLKLANASDVEGTQLIAQIAN